MLRGPGVDESGTLDSASRVSQWVKEPAKRPLYCSEARPRIFRNFGTAVLFVVVIARTFPQSVRRGGIRGSSRHVAYHSSEQPFSLRRAPKPPKSEIGRTDPLCRSSPQAVDPT
jgi:hypothetical protein